MFILDRNPIKHRIQINWNLKTVMNQKLATEHAHCARFLIFVNIMWYVLYWTVRILIQISNSDERSPCHNDRPFYLDLRGLRRSCYWSSSLFIDLKRALSASSFPASISPSSTPFWQILMQPHIFAKSFHN